METQEENYEITLLLDAAGTKKTYPLKSYCLFYHVRKDTYPPGYTLSLNLLCNNIDEVFLKWINGLIKDTRCTITVKGKEEVRRVDFEKFRLDDYTDHITSEGFTEFYLNLTTDRLVINGVETCTGDEVQN